MRHELGLESYLALLIRRYSTRLDTLERALSAALSLVHRMQDKEQQAEWQKNTYAAKRGTI